MRYFLLAIFCVLTACSDTRVVTLLEMDFTEAEDATVSEFRQGRSGGLLFFVDSENDVVIEGISIRNGKLFLTDVARTDPNSASFVPAQNVGTSLLYNWRAEMNEARMISGTGSIVNFVLEVRVPRGEPYVAAQFRLESVDAPEGRRITVTTDAADEPIGILRLGAPHSITMLIDIEDQTFRVFGGNSGGIDSGELPLLGPIRPSFVPPLQITPMNAGASAVEYTFENMRILSVEPTP